MAFASSAQQQDRQQTREQQNPSSFSSPVAAAPKRAVLGKTLFVSGGAASATTSKTAAAGGGQAGFGLASAWGVVSVVYILMNAVKRLMPIALQPFSRVREVGTRGTVDIIAETHRRRGGLYICVRSIRRAPDL